MTRAWSTHTKSALGAKKHSGVESLGPSDVPYAYTTNSATASNHAISIDGRLFVGKQSLGTTAYTTYYCYTNLGGCSSAPTNPSYTDEGVRTFQFYTPYRESYSDVTDHEIDHTLLGLYAHYANTSTWNCYETFRMSERADFGDNIRIPRDTVDPVLYAGCTVRAAAEADRTSGSIGACGTGWSPSTPSDDLVYRDESASVTDCYHIMSRADEDSAWAPLVVAADLPSGATASGFWRLNQTTERIWWSDGATTIKVWPIGTAYTDASPTSITLPAGNVNGIIAWGATTFVFSTNGNIYYYHGATYGGALGSPFDAVTWDWASIAHGWCVVTDGGTSHFWRVTDTAVTFDQSLSGTMLASSPVGESYCIARTIGGTQPYQRLIYDHASGLWENGGGVPHLEAEHDAGYTYWYDSIYRHIILRQWMGSFYQFQFVQLW